LPDPLAAPDARIHELHLARSLKNASCTPADKTPRRFYSNHPRAQGLHPPDVLVCTLWKVNSDEIEKKPPPRVILPESPEGSGTIVGDLIPGYPRRWN